MSLTDVCAKRFSGKYSASQLALGRILYSLPALWALAAIEGVPAVEPDILWVYAAGIPIETVAVLLYMKSLSISPLSLTVPFLSFTPAFLLISSPLITGESPSTAGAGGVFLIAAGAYWLGAIRGGVGVIPPLRALVREKGPMMMLAAAFIYSITSSLGRVGVTKSGPAFFAATYMTLLAAALAAVASARGHLRGMTGWELILLGFMNSFMITFHMLAIQLIQASYMIALKRSSLLFGIIFGVIFFGETGLKMKLAAGMLMLAGIAAITLAG